MIGIDGMLAVKKLHIVHKNRMHRNEATGSESDVDVGWERSEPIVQQKTPTSKSRLERTHMKHFLEFDGTVTGSV